MPEPRWSGAVLCGGASRRMGRDKALLSVAGTPLVVRATQVLSQAGGEPVVVVGGDSRRFTHLGLRHVADEHPGAGPLGGILTALHWSPAPVVAVVAVDLVDLDPVTVAQVVDAAAAADVAVAHSGRDEPLCAAWRVRRCEPVVRAAFTAGERAVHRAWSGLDVVRVPVDAARLTNANMPEDLDGR